MPQLVQLIGLIPFLVTWVAYKPYIAFLQRQRVEQYIREEGPKSHSSKAKTPTMGGLCFMLLGPVCMLAIYGLGLLLPGADQHQITGLLQCSAVVTLAAWACGVLGLADDLAKLHGRSNKGLSARFRLAVEYVIGLAFALTLTYMLPEPGPISAHMGTWHHADALIFGAVQGHGLWVGLASAVQMVYVLIVIPFIFMATTNAVNLHDGMDGLAAGTSIIVLLGLAYFLAATGQNLSELAIAQAAAVTAFLCYNKNPAKVFMGDTGSLFLGGMIAGLVVTGGLTIWFVPLAVIYIAEAVSVMAQVSYFKLTKPYQSDPPMHGLKLAFYKLTHRLPGDGKRLLRMAPLHHHFEALAADHGIGEASVVAMFWLAQLIVCGLTIGLFTLFSHFLTGH